MALCMKLNESNQHRFISGHQATYVIYSANVPFIVLEVN